MHWLEPFSFFPIEDIWYSSIRQKGMTREQIILVIEHDGQESALHITRILCLQLRMPKHSIFKQPEMIFLVKEELTMRQQVKLLWQQVLFAMFWLSILKEALGDYDS